MAVSFSNSSPAWPLYGDNESPILVADVSQGSQDPRVLLQMVRRDMVEKIQKTAMAAAAAAAAAAATTATVPAGAAQSCWRGRPQSNIYMYDDTLAPHC
eukprot:459312-Amphidinium_carterae.1